MAHFLWNFYVTLLLTWTPAQAYTPNRGDIHVAAGAYMYRTDLPEDNAFNFQSGSPSLTILGDLSDHGSLEISLGFLNKRYMIRENNQTLLEQAQVVLAGFGYRYWLDNRFSVSTLIYTSYPMISSDVLIDTFPERKYTTAHQNSETGIEFRTQYEVWGNAVWGLSVEGRYAYAINRQADEYLNQYGLFIGLRHLIQQSTTSDVLDSR